MLASFIMFILLYICIRRSIEHVLNTTKEELRRVKIGSQRLDTRRYKLYQGITRITTASNSWSTRPFHGCRWLVNCVSDHHQRLHSQKYSSSISSFSYSTASKNISSWSSSLCHVMGSISRCWIDFPPNIRLFDVTLDTSQDPMSWLKAVALRNIPNMFLTPDTFQDPLG
jgi:hypothetical protein